ncbi:MAG TPA: hypothetical protein VJ302_30240 [Blastocatellia bacterium]|nr:hypothetical protein [Blastocatellia bacterium]
MIALILLGLIVSSCRLPLSSATSSYGEASQPGEVTEQVNKTVTLAPGAGVKISGLNGRVTIETSSSDKAEINITIKASDREAIERRPLLIENTPNSLVIRTKEGEKWNRDRGWVRHEVRLRLPKSIDLNVSGINGQVDVGQITGQIEISGINGQVEVAQAGTATRISGINGRTAISLVQLGQGGLRVSGINGGVEIGLPSATNAEVDVSGVNGGIDTDLPITILGEIKRGQLRGTIGSGGPSINISGINGGVVLRRI